MCPAFKAHISLEKTEATGLEGMGWGVGDISAALGKAKEDQEIYDQLFKRSKKKKSLPKLKPRVHF